MDAGGRVACFLLPLHAAQVRVALQILRPEQAVIALCPDETALAVLLHCEEFSHDIAAHRLWFAWGESWAQELERLFDERPGLALPAQFIRASAADTGPADALIPIAQPIFHAVAERRLLSVRHTRETWQRSRTAACRTCVVAPSHFRLWDTAGPTLADTLSGAAGLEVIRFDSDDPLCASPEALATEAAGCDAIITPGTARGDLPDIVPLEMPWVMWVVGPRIPAASAAGPRDGLLLADASWLRMAVEAGWPAERVAIAGWPAHARLTSDSSTEPDRPLALVADTRVIRIPDAVAEYSSHRLLWECIEEELGSDPFLLLEGAERYLIGSMRRLQIGEEGFDRRPFLQCLIEPAYQQALARLLLFAGLPLKLWGAGWESLEEFSSSAAGIVSSRSVLADILRGSAGLIHAWPISHAHPIEAVPAPIARPARSAAETIRRARALLSGEPPRPHTIAAPLDAQRVTTLLERLRAE